eukprot:TRINITY_DN66756_c0_g1_i1.p1 TRINITY_DN66756_c0_g1~~TRINITY_DN66756_c0_g1_i1.p1  ORF type:complete len:221 (+),score=79.41 TRINITY_DN66756_c0_g1_i1:101-763(+)
MGDSQKSIRYAAVYVNERLLGEYPPKEYPRYAETVAKVAEKEARQPQYKKCKLLDDTTQTHINYFTTGDGKFYACVSSTQMETRRTFGLLVKLESLFRAPSSQYRGEREVSADIRKQLDWYNDPGNDQLLQAQKVVEDTKNVMMENMDDMLQRGDRLETMMQKTDELQTDAQKFHKKAVRVRKQACWEDYKTRLMLACVVIAVLAIILMIACKPNFSDCS